MKRKDVKIVITDNRLEYYRKVFGAGDRSGSGFWLVPCPDGFQPARLFLKRTR